MWPFVLVSEKIAPGRTSNVRSNAWSSVDALAAPAANGAIRDRLAAQFRALGYDVTIQRSFACGAWLTCSPIANVIARTPGDARPNALLLAAHYDSVPAGPGVSDDGVGVATLLETARALRNERFGNPILYVATDAEEAGLLGAEGFVGDAG